MNGLLLAAGLGTRFLPFTKFLPKPAIPLLNVPIAFYNLHLLQEVGVKCLTVNTHHLPNEVKNLFSGNDNISIPIKFSDEVGEILGTGGAIKRARQNLEGSGSFLVANADVVNGFAIKDAWEFHQKEKPLATMVVMEHPDAGTKYGAVWVDSQNKVVGISKDRPQRGGLSGDLKPLHFVGIHMISDRIFPFIPDGPCDINRDVYLKAIKQGEKVLAFEKKGLWFDAGSLGDYLEATEKLLRYLPKLQTQPFLLSLYRRFWREFEMPPSQSSILMGWKCQIHASVKVTGFAVFGDEVIVEKNVQLENVVLGSGVNLSAGRKISNTLILNNL